MLHPRPYYPPRLGFTLIEMLVAISVLALMLSLSARIFFDAQQGVDRGLQTSQIIAEQRAISQPLANDLRKMHVFTSKYGGSTPGFLLIKQNEFGGVKFPDVDDFTGDTNSWGTQTIRSDEIAFFIDAQGLESLTPGGDDRYDSEARATTARVWYGHVWPTDLPVPAAGSNPGNGDYDISSQLMLGRQALLLVEESSSTNYPDGTAGDGSVPSGGSSRERGAYITDPLVYDVIWEGDYDVLDLRDFTDGGPGNYSVYYDNGVDPAGSGPRGLFGSPTWENLGTVSEPSFFGQQVTMTRGTSTSGLPIIATGRNYPGAARQWMFPNNNRRLQATRSFDNDFSAGIFAPDDIAKLHAAFSPHVAEFAIEFAADWQDDFDPNDLDNDGNVNEPDGLPDGTPDRDPAGNVKWYTTIDANPADGFGVPRDTSRRNEPITYSIYFDPSSPVQSEISEFNGTFNSTALLWDPTGTADHPFFYYGDTFVFSHVGDDYRTDNVVEGCGKYWPYLIRFRYRLMDGKGEFRSNDPVTGEPVVGRWFELIVPVPRPKTTY